MGVGVVNGIRGASCRLGHLLALAQLLVVSCAGPAVNAEAEVRVVVSVGGAGDTSPIPLERSGGRARLAGLGRQAVDEAVIALPAGLEGLVPEVGEDAGEATCSIVVREVLGALALHGVVVIGGSLGASVGGVGGQLLGAVFGHHVIDGSLWAAHAGILGGVVDRVVGARVARAIQLNGRVTGAGLAGADGLAVHASVLAGGAGLVGGVPVLGLGTSEALHPIVVGFSGWADAGIGLRVQLSVD